MNIQPDEIPEDAEILDSNELKGSNVTYGHLSFLEDKNVLVNFKNGSTEVGMLHNIEGNTFMLGTKSDTFFFSDVDSFREI